MIMAELLKTINDTEAAQNLIFWLYCEVNYSFLGFYYDAFLPHVCRSLTAALSIRRLAIVQTRFGVIKL